jgi:hypothetical protein
MPAEPRVPTVSDVVHRAVTVVDPDGDHESLAALPQRFEDSDEPVTAEADIEFRLAEADIEFRLAEAKGALDPQDEDPAVQMATAVATYLAHRRSEIAAEREEILRWPRAPNSLESRRPKLRDGLLLKGLRFKRWALGFGL